MSKEIETYNPTEESVVVYRSADNAVQLDVQLADETVWLTQAHFGVRKCVGIKSATVLQKFKNIKQWINKALLHISQRLTASCTR